MSQVHPKVVASSLAGAVTVIIVWALSEVGVDIPPEVSSAITVVLSAAAGWIKSSP